uniref:Bacteriorhodopsin-like protein n=1 Tax=viral metagenome TaxID=1070528 RepID=A0A6C0BH11_9ZZZZ
MCSVDQKDKDVLVKTTFYITYVLLITTGTITLIEAIATKNPQIRHIMNLETCISIVAAFFYSKFIAQISSGQISYRDINITRYSDWFITTPLMLLVLCLVLSFNDKRYLHISTFIWILLMNMGMLISGYLGEVKKIDKRTAQIVGFIFFCVLFGIIWYSFVAGNESFNNLSIYFAFVIVWAIYGVVYMQSEETKNIAYNVLDVIAKCFIGIFFWMYFTKVIVF